MKKAAEAAPSTASPSASAASQQKKGTQPAQNWKRQDAQSAKRDSKRQFILRVQSVATIETWAQLIVARRVQHQTSIEWVNKSKNQGKKSKKEIKLALHQRTAGRTASLKKDFSEDRKKNSSNFVPKADSAKFNNTDRTANEFIRIEFHE